MGRAGRPPGLPKTGGRVKGTINKPKPGVGYVRALMEEMGVNTFELQALAAVGMLPCIRCRAEEKPGRLLRVVVIDQETGECVDTLTECVRCEGTGYEQIPATARLRSAADLNMYQQPRLSHATLDGDLKLTPNRETLAEFLAKSKALRAMYPHMKARALAPPVIDITKASE